MRTEACKLRERKDLVALLHSPGPRAASIGQHLGHGLSETGDTHVNHDAGEAAASLHAHGLIFPSLSTVRRTPNTTDARRAPASAKMAGQIPRARLK